MSAPDLTTAEGALEPNSLPESKDLIALESVIERGLETFVQVGEALAEIRDRKLYRIEHPTFEKYLRAKWNMERRNGYDLIAAATAAKNVQSIAQIDRGTARVIAKLPTPELQREALKESIAANPGSEPTPRVVRPVVEARLELVGKSAGESRGRARRGIDFFELETRIESRCSTLAMSYGSEARARVVKIMRAFCEREDGR